MLRKQRLWKLVPSSGRIGATGGLFVFAISLSGCSADVGRFDLTSVNDSGSSKQSPVPSEPLRRNAGIPTDAGDAYRNQASGAPASEPPVRMSSLPDATPRDMPPTASRPLPPAQPKRTASAPIANPQPARIPSGPTSAPGETIDVQPGDTLYGLSKRHRVSVSELMSLNNLQNPNLRPGQKLTLPAGKRAVAKRPPAAAETPTSIATAPVSPPKTASARAPVAPPTDWAGTHTVAQGESLYAIARRHNVRVADLQAANGITEPTKVRPGTALKVPGNGTSSPAANQAPVVAQQSGPAMQPTLVNAQRGEAAAGERVASLKSPASQSDAVSGGQVEPTAAVVEEPKAAAGPTRFRWPVKGKVIAGFGPRPDKSHNDGINISVPQGAEVVSAENGVVAYAGNELKGYGNLVLVRHEGNWVSAYAHNSELLVKRGDKVKRGQTLAKAGNSGTVDQPQVHFELRQGSRPVDPMPHMEKN